MKSTKHVSTPLAELGERGGKDFTSQEERLCVPLFITSLTSYAADVLEAEDLFSLKCSSRTISPC